MGQARWGSVSSGHWGEMECEINTGSELLPRSPRTPYLKCVSKEYLI